MKRVSIFLASVLLVPGFVSAQTTFLTFDVTSTTNDVVDAVVWTSVTPSTLGSATIDVLFDHLLATYDSCSKGADLNAAGNVNACVTACLAVEPTEAVNCAVQCSVLNPYTTFSCDNSADGLVRVTITANVDMGDNVAINVGSYSESWPIEGLQVGSSEGTASDLASLTFTPPAAKTAAVAALTSYDTNPGSLSLGFYASENNSGGEDQITDECATGACQFVDTQLPVELVEFTATADDEAVVLNWSTASETNNAGFSIEHALGDSEEFAELAFVDGHGTSDQEQVYSFRATGLDVGRHNFRLRQVDFDGTFEYSPVVESVIELAGTHRLGAAYPNPFNPATTFELVVGRDQIVQVDVVNALGQRVQRLFDGSMEANEPRNFVFEAGALPSGLYFYRVAGETFAETKQMLLVK
jgi:hypothetical protein